VSVVSIDPQQRFFEVPARTRGIDAASQQQAAVLCVYQSVGWLCGQGPAEAILYLR
jgi:hypothetical protein